MLCQGRQLAPLTAPGSCDAALLQSRAIGMSLEAGGALGPFDRAASGYRRGRGSSAGLVHELA
jgi:hypothetical protein